eukprot:5459526-Pyramimonas_sp.AAC.1
MDQHSNMRPTTEAAQRVDSMTGQQQWMRGQMQEVVGSMSRHGTDMPYANLTPPWSMCLAQIRRRIIRTGIDAFLHFSATQPVIRQLLEGRWRRRWIWP